jgi:putative transposase
MPRKSFRPEEIIAKLREADVLLGQGKRVAEVVKALGVSEVKLRDELLDQEIFHSLRG